MKTTNFKKVLIALEYDATSTKVAEIGFSLAQAMHAETILLHVINELPVYYSAYTYNHEFKVDMLGDLKLTTQKFLDKAKKHLGDDKSIKTVLKDGEIAETILKTAKEMDADVIVMGSHSRKWLEDIIMGSEAENMLKNSQIPLLIIPTKKKDD
ncbi:universal stress protein [Flavobacterium sp. UBA6031]|uniref:universal stress protein n=1 Tax=Flavobacterium sp. UBA6031 TaxID=1946551 RepID=UPI0025C1297A|nr:universal stress protein [Flavobacterium sp. UBA6031]